MIVDTFSHFLPAIEPRFIFRGTDKVEVLERFGREVGIPGIIRVDQGSEFVFARFGSMPARGSLPCLSFRRGKAAVLIGIAQMPGQSTIWQHRTDRFLLRLPIRTMLRHNSPRLTLIIDVLARL